MCHWLGMAMRRHPGTCHAKPDHVIDISSTRALRSAWRCTTGLRLVTLRPESWLVPLMQSLSPGNNAKLQTYLEKVGHDNLAFGIDLSHNAKHRCRVARETRMATLTKKNAGLGIQSTCSVASDSRHIFIVLAMILYL